jgi:flagellar basal-body rod protein FlgB
MNLNDIPLFQMLKGRLGYLDQRQQTIAENVANASTPGYVARDLKAFSFDAQVQSQQLAMSQPTAPAKTSPMHLDGTRAPPRRSQTWRTVSSPDSETTLDGNQVVLEEQMMKMTDARMNYEAAIGFYQKSLSLLRMAARPPGRG